MKNTMFPDLLKQGFGQKGGVFKIYENFAAYFINIDDGF